MVSTEVKIIVGVVLIVYFFWPFGGKDRKIRVLLKEREQLSQKQSAVDKKLNSLGFFEPFHPKL